MRCTPMCHAWFYMKLAARRKATSMWSSRQLRSKISTDPTGFTASVGAFILIFALVSVVLNVMSALLVVLACLLGIILRVGSRHYPQTTGTVVSTLLVQLLAVIASTALTPILHGPPILRTRLSIRFSADFDGVADTSRPAPRTTSGMDGVFLSHPHTGRDFPTTGFSCTCQSCSVYQHTLRRSDSTATVSKGMEDKNVTPTPLYQNRCCWWDCVHHRQHGDAGHTTGTGL